MPAAATMTAAERKAQVREQVRTEFPGVRVRVTTRKNGGLTVAWADGPTPLQLRTACAGASHARLCRTTTETVTTVAYLRARARGFNFYSEDDHPLTPRFFALVPKKAQVASIDDTVDAATITEDEELRAAVVHALVEANRAELQQRVAWVDGTTSQPRALIASAIYHFGELVDATLT